MENLSMMLLARAVDPPAAAKSVVNFRHSQASPLSIALNYL